MATIRDTTMDIDTNETINVVLILCLHEFAQICRCRIRLTFDTLKISTHFLLEREAIQLEDLWELELTIHLLVAKRVIIKHDSLQVNNENIWHGPE